MVWKLSKKVEGSSSDRSLNRGRKRDFHFLHSIMNTNDRVKNGNVSYLRDDRNGRRFESDRYIRTGKKDPRYESFQN